MLPNFHEKLIVLLAVGVLQGWLTTEASKANFLQALRARDVAAAASSGSQDRESMKQNEEKLQKLRGSCKNAVHTSVMAMLQPGFHFDLSLISFCSMPFRKWHGDVARRLRSSEASVEYYIEMAKMDEACELTKVMHKVMAPYDSPERLATAGFVVQITGAADQKSLAIDTPEYLYQQDMTNRMWRLNLKLAENFIVNFSFHSQSYPGKFAKLLDDDEMARAAAWADMKADWDAWKATQKCKSQP